MKQYNFILETKEGRQYIHDAVDEIRYGMNPINIIKRLRARKMPRKEKISHLKKLIASNLETPDYAKEHLGLFGVTQNHVNALDKLNKLYHYAT